MFKKNQLKLNIPFLSSYVFNQYSFNLICKNFIFEKKKNYNLNQLFLIFFLVSNE